MLEIQATNQKLPSQKIIVPGSKSYSNRALLLAALANGNSYITGILESEDTKVMISALKILGIRIKKVKSIYQIQGSGGQFKKPTRPLMLENAGTAIRSLTAALSTQAFTTTLTGNKRMCERPIQDLINALMPLGATTKSTNGCPPVRTKGPLHGGKTSVKGSISSQYLSSLLMAAPYAQNTVKIQVQGMLTSLHYVEMTLSIMERFGVKPSNKNYQSFTIQPEQYKGTSYTVEGDASSATYPLALAALHGFRMTINNIPSNSKQADMLFLNVLKKMGCQVTSTKNSISVKGPKKLTSLGNIDLNKLPDAAMTVATLCAFTKGRSKLTGIGNLRVKETDRLHALSNELTKVGVKVIEGKDFLEIHGNPEELHGGIIETYNDHRMAMCFAIAGSRIQNIRITNPDCVQKTYPTFWKDLKKWGISNNKIKKNKSPNLILAGLRGSGKSSVGKKLAQELSYNFIDTDELIIKHFGPIPDIVKKYGWNHFRVIEAQIAKKLSSTNKTVISTGGGMFINPQNIKNLKKSGYIALLKANAKIFAQRIEKDPQRPRLTSASTITQEMNLLWNERRKSYFEAADFVIDVTKQSSNAKNDIKTKARQIISTFTLLV